MVEPPDAEEFTEAIPSNEVARPPGSEQVVRDNQTMATLLNLLGKKPTIVLLPQFATGDGPLRFSELEEVVDIASNTLSNRLEELSEVGLLTRKANNEIPPRVEYIATEKARDLAPVFWYLGVGRERYNLELISTVDG